MSETGIKDRIYGVLMADGRVTLCGSRESAVRVRETTTYGHPEVRAEVVVAEVEWESVGD